jgi:hypothetical protein
LSQTFDQSLLLIKLFLLNFDLIFKRLILRGLNFDLCFERLIFRLRGFDLRLLLFDGVLTGTVAIWLYT